MIAGNGTLDSTLTLNRRLTLNDNSTIKLVLGTKGTHSTLARDSMGLPDTWIFDNDQSFTINSDAELGTYTGIITGLTGEEEGLASIATWNVITPGYKTAVFSLNDDGTEVNLKLSGVATLLKIK